MWFRSLIELLARSSRRRAARSKPAARRLFLEGLEDRWRWSQLELLWSMNQRQIWETVGVASSVFTLAQAGRVEDGLVSLQHAVQLARPDDQEPRKALERWRAKVKP